MKTVSFIIIIFLLVFPSIASLPGNWIINGGVNYSVPVNEKSYEVKPGYNFGIGRNFKLYKSLYLFTGAQYDKRNFVLKDRVIIPTGPNTTDVYSWDVHVNVSFIEIPLILKYRFSHGNKFSIMPLLGVTYPIPYKDNSSVTKKSFQFIIDDPPGPNTYFDNSFSQETFFDIDNSHMIYNIGLEFSWNYLLLDLRYCYDPNPKLSIIDLLIPFKGEMNIFRISIGFNF